MFLADMSVDKDTLDQLRITREPETRRFGVLWALVAAILLLALGGGYVWWRVQGVEWEVTTVAAVEISSGERHTVLNASGYVTARRDATVSSKVTGKIVEVRVEEGMSVAEGQVLGLVLGESFALAGLGGALGLGLAWTLIAGGDPTNGALPIFYFPTDDLS